MGGAAKTIGRVGSGILTLGGSEIARNNLPSNSVVSQALNAPGVVLTGGLSGPGAMPSLFGGLSGTGNGTNPNLATPFALDPAMLAKDQSDINSLGQQQYQSTLGAIDTNSQAETERAKALFGQMLPDIAENANAAHLYDSTGYGQEVARQQSNIASQIAANDAQQKMQALQGLQGFQTGALQRGQSLEDFVNQSNVARAIGAQTAPLPPSGKQNFGTVAQGVGALATPLARAYSK